jgi:Rhodopirellula transposase DDE domain
VAAANIAMSSLKKLPLSNVSIWNSVDTVSKFMASATTLKGLRVFTTILDRTYKTGQKVADGFEETMEICFDDFLPQWNYTAKPQPS